MAWKSLCVTLVMGRLHLSARQWRHCALLRLGRGRRRPALHIFIHDHRSGGLAQWKLWRGPGPIGAERRN